MSLSWAIQKAVFARLRADAGVAALVGVRVYDNPPADAVLPYLSFGPVSVVVDRGDCFTARAETVQIDCWSAAQDGFRECKTMVDAVITALDGWSGALEQGAMSGCSVDLVRVFRDADGITSHGVVQVTVLAADG